MPLPLPQKLTKTPSPDTADSIPTCPQLLPDDSPTSSTTSDNTDKNNTAGPPGINNYLEHHPNIDIDAFESVDKLVRGSSALMNGYEVPDFVESAGGLQALSFFVDHRDDLVAEEMTSLNLAKFAIFSPPRRHGGNHHHSPQQQPPQQRRGDRDKATTAAEPTKPTAAAKAAKKKGSGDTAAPMVHARIPKEILGRFLTGTHDDDVFDLWTESLGGNVWAEDGKRSPEDGKRSPEADKDGLTENRVAEMGSDVLSGAVTPSTQAADVPSILMHSSQRRARSADESLNESRIFSNRVVMRQETMADLNMFRAYDFVLAYFESQGYQVDECRSSASSQVSQMSRRSSRNRIAVVHGEDFAERSPRRVRSDEANRAAFQSATVLELYEKLNRAYRAAGVPKAYMDTLLIEEVEKGTRVLRPKDTHRKEGSTAGRSVSPLLSDDDDNGDRELDARMRATEVALGDFELERAVRDAVKGEKTVTHKDLVALRRVQASQAAAEKAAAEAAAKKQKGGLLTRLFRLAPPPTAPAALTPPPNKQITPYEFLKKTLKERESQYFYQHNAMSFRTYKMLKRSGDVFIHGERLRLHLWDHPKYGYLATGVFDRNAGYPKNYKDPCTNFIYAEELSGGKSTSYAVPELRRQHNAVGARRAVVEDGITIRGCAVVRQCEVYSIYDGRVSGCQVDRLSRDTRRSGIHAAITCLAHYRNLFPKHFTLFRLLHPHDRYHYPVVNPVGGMYCVPLIINGATRLVKVDDYVPTDPVTGVFRCLTSNANELFPTLLEKALLKANNGGATVSLMEPSTVMHQLCGWIPWNMRFAMNRDLEEVLYDGMLTAPEMWDHLLEMYRHGRMVMSFMTRFATAELKSARAFPPYPPGSPVPLFATDKAYPVVDMISRLENVDGRGQRRIRAVMLRDTTKDPMQAEFVPPMATTISDAVLSSIGYNNYHREAGVFCLTWEEATSFFHRVDISLNPALLWSRNELKLRPHATSRICCHGVCEVKKIGLDIYHQPQFHLRFTNVQASTQVFIVYTPHVSRQHPLPWPCEGLQTPTVGKCSDGGYEMVMRVFDVTSLPSIVQVQHAKDDRVAQKCCFEHCVARRLTAEHAGPFWRQGPIPHNWKLPYSGVQWCTTSITRHNDVAHRPQMVSFDVSPGTREYVVSLEFLVRYEYRMADPMADLPYTITLYSNMTPAEEANPHSIPFIPAHPMQSPEDEEDAAQAERGKGDDDDLKKCGLAQLLEEQENQTKLKTATASMHLIPPALGVNARTVKGLWKRSNRALHSIEIREAGLLHKKLWTGQQYHLHLSQPDDFSIRLCPHRQPPIHRNAAKLKVMLVRRKDRKAAAIAGNLMEECDLVVASKCFDGSGAEVSTTLSHSVLVDHHKDLVSDPLKFRQEFHGMVHVTVRASTMQPTQKSHSLLIRYPNPSDTVRWLILRIFADGTIVSPAACRVLFMGHEVGLDVELRTLFADVRGTYTFNEESGVWKPVTEEKKGLGLGLGGLSVNIYIDLTVEGTSHLRVSDFPENEESGRLAERLRNVIWSSFMAGSEQPSCTLRAVAYLQKLIRSTSLAEDRAAFLLGVAESIADWCNKCSARVTHERPATPPLLMSKLPAGDYVIIPGFELEGQMQMTTFPPKERAPFPVYTENLPFDLRVELLRQRVDIEAIPDTAPQLAEHNAPQCAFLDEFPTPT